MNNIKKKDSFINFFLMKQKKTQKKIKKKSKKKMKYNF